MKYLIDTHILLWAVDEEKSRMLTSRTRSILSNENNQIYYSPVSIWEIIMKQQKNPGQLTKLPIREFVEKCKQMDFQELQLNTIHVYELETLSRPENAPKHNDPFDKILIAQTKAEGIRFLTHDDLLNDYDEDCVIIV